LKLKEKWLSLDGWIRRLPLLPALIFTIVVTQIPFVLSIYYSLTNWTIFPRNSDLVWFENYIDLLDDRFFKTAAWVSITMTVSAVLISVVVGTFFAILLNRKFFGQGLARTLIITPFLVMPVVAALIWKTQFLGFDFGLLNTILGTIGIDRIEFASRFPFWSVVVTLVWQWTPFMMLIILAGLQSQSSSILEAAKVDGASSRSTFLQITVPHLKPYFELGTLLGVIYLSQVFDHIEIITGGNESTKNAPYYIYQKAFIDNSYGSGSSYSVVVVIASIIIATFGIRLLSGLLADNEGA